MKLDLFFYDLPKSFIAQKPLKRRDQSKLLVLDRNTGNLRHDIFAGLAKYLKSGDVLVLNKTKVARCRLIGNKVKTGTEIECFILKKTEGNRCQCLLKPYRRLKDEDLVQVGENNFRVIEKLGYGKAIIEFDKDPDLIIKDSGMVPLPPYIKNKSIDEKLYQTVYARDGFSAAGPTAGFHFTKELIGSLKEKGIVFAAVRLDIGLDTFRPIVEENVEEHVIHSENYSIVKKEAEKINSCRKKGGRIIAVGTTATRVLETVSEKNGSLRACNGSTSLYIYPGYKFKAVDAMITNFHLPYSTLLVMVSAFAGREKILNAYEAAKIKSYRFYSFGDCMLII